MATSGAPAVVGPRLCFFIPVVACRCATLALAISSSSAFSACRFCRSSSAASFALASSCNRRKAHD
eukprot:5434512-Prymnesium_polylepis.1